MATITPEHVERLLRGLRHWFPGWQSTGDERFVRDETSYKQRATREARELLAESELRDMLDLSAYDEILTRIEKAGRSTNLLYNGVPTSDDLNILYVEGLDKAAFLAAFVDLLHGPGDGIARLRRYLRYVVEHGLPNKWMFCTHFTFLLDPDHAFSVKPRAARWMTEALDGPAWQRAPSAAYYGELLALAEGVRDAMADYGVRDLRDVQSVVWCAYRAEQTQSKEEREVRAVREETEEYEPELAEPFDTIFRSWDEAEWFFDLAQELLTALGMPDRATESVTISMRSTGRSLKIVLGERSILELQRSYRLAVVLRGEDARDLTDVLERREMLDYAGGPTGMTRCTLDRHGFTGRTDVVEAIRRSYPSHREYASHWPTSPHRAAHRPELERAAYDVAFRHALLTGRPVEDLAPNSPKPSVNPDLSLADIAAQTSFPEGELAAWVGALHRKGQAILYGPPGTARRSSPSSWPTTSLAGETGLRGWSSSTRRMPMRISSRASAPRAPARTS